MERERERESDSFDVSFLEFGQVVPLHGSDTRKIRGLWGMVIRPGQRLQVTPRTSRNINSSKQRTGRAHAQSKSLSLRTGFARQTVRVLTGRLFISGPLSYGCFAMVLRLEYTDAAQAQCLAGSTPSSPFLRDRLLCSGLVWRFPGV